MLLWRIPVASLVLLVISSAYGQRPIYPDLPSPRLVIVGPTGAGKSSLANAFLGCDPRIPDCMFNVCDSMDSCTKETTWGMGPWLGTGQNCTVIDTPGFGDSDNQDEELIEEMMDILANVVEHSDTMLLLLKGTETRFGESLQTMIKRMTLMFGVQWWDYVIVGVSFWAYDEESIKARYCDPDYPALPCKDESWFKSEITNQLNEKFNVNKNFTFVFTDAFSQTAGPPKYSTDDDLQQEHWQEETDILWGITTSRNESFGFMTINDFMEENARQKAEIKWLNDIIESNITGLQKNFKNLEENLLPAVGSIIAWLPTGPDPEHHHVDPLPIPLGWQRCDGSVITDPSSPFYSLSTPNINGEEYFIRGGRDDQAATMQEDMIKGHLHTVTDSGHKHSDTGHLHLEKAHTHTANEHKHTAAEHTHIAAEHTHIAAKHTHIAAEHSHIAAKHKHNIDSAQNNYEKDDSMTKGNECFETQDGNCWYRDSNIEDTVVTMDAQVVTMDAPVVTMDAQVVTMDAPVVTMDDTVVTIQATTNTMHSATAKITSEHTGIEVNSFGGLETRPKNFAAVYIMRIF